MEPKIFEKLITDLKNLPKTKAPENLEEKLFSKINQYNNAERKLVKDKLFFFKVFKEPVFATALSVIVVFVLVLAAIQSNDNHLQTVTKVLEKATPNVSEDKESKVIPLKNKINISQKKIAKAIQKRSSEPLPFQIGAGTNLDAPNDVSKSIETEASSSLGIETGFPNEPVQIRVPPPARLGPNVFFEEQKALKSNFDSIPKAKTKKRNN